MILRKSNEGEDILGLKVIGGQVLSNGRLGAIIEKVKRGSIADQEGHIRPGNLNNYTFRLQPLKDLYVREDLFKFCAKFFTWCLHTFILWLHVCICEALLVEIIHYKTSQLLFGAKFKYLFNRLELLYGIFIGLLEFSM